MLLVEEQVVATVLNVSAEENINNAPSLYFFLSSWQIRNQVDVTHTLDACFHHLLASAGENWPRLWQCVLFKVFYDKGRTPSTDAISRKR